MTARGKRSLFWGVTLLLPFVFLGAVELVLRSTDTCAPEPLFIDVPGSQGALVKFNPWVTRRYFDSTQCALPNLAPELFTRDKGPNTFRILCLGESTTAGFPFQSQVPFPPQLRELLAHAYPRKRIEVLNAGISAISSYVVLDMLPEFLETTKPDLVIAYLGHNEFYGVYGSGSTLFPVQKRALVTVMLRLQHLHLVQLVKRGLQLFKSRPAAPAGNRTLMQTVVGDQDIAFGSHQYCQTMDVFRANLEAIADLCRDRGVPILLSNLVSNYADHPPFHSLTRPESAALVETALRDGDAFLAGGKSADAEAMYLNAWHADSGNADAWFGMGRARLAQGDSAAALHWFAGAIDRDAMRFRASEDANQIIEATAARSHAGFVDMLTTFRRASREGIIGRDLMVDHLHPNPQGYYLMAEAMYRGVLKLGVLPPPDSSYVPPGSPYAVTDLDWEMGLLKIFPMLHEWPFRQVHVSRSDYHSHGDTAATRIALQYLREGFAWARAHDMMAHVYLDRKNFEGAKREYLAIAVHQPEDPWPYQQIATMFEMQGDWPRRSAALQEALMRSPVKGMLAYQLALSEWKQGHLHQALQAMEFASGAPELKQEERENARFYLAGFLSDSGQPQRARAVLRAILAENPSFVPAQKFLQQLERTP
jgi:lysophospholipase L1-like esterase